MNLLPMLAWAPFVHPLYAAYRWWPVLLLPLAFGIAMIYKAYRMPSLERYWRQVTIMTMQVIVAFAALAAGLFILVQVVVPLIPSD